MKRKDNAYYCDCCKKKIKRKELIFAFKDNNSFCERCFLSYVKVRNKIGINWQCRTFVDVADVTSVFDGVTSEYDDEDIPY